MSLNCSHPHSPAGDGCWHHVVPRRSEHPASLAVRAVLGNPSPGLAGGKGRQLIPPSAAALASFLQLMLFWAKLEADSSWGWRNVPARPSAPAAVRSPRSRWSNAPRAPHHQRHAGARVCTRPQRHSWGSDACVPWTFGTLPQGWGAAKGLPTEPGNMAASSWAWQ